MSFILDALRKSDQTRQTHTLQIDTTPITPPVSEPATPQASRRIWPGGMLLLGLGLLLGWWQPWSSSKNMAATPALAPTAPTAQSVASPPATALIQPPKAPLPAKPASRTGHTAPFSISTTSSAPPVAPPRVKSPLSPSHPENEASEQPDAPMENLPANLLTEIPRITVAAHSYSRKQKTSFIFANNRMLHEGDTVSPGLRLEQITTDGMIFSYNGYRFQRGLQP